MNQVPRRYRRKSLLTGDAPATSHQLNWLLTPATRRDWWVSRQSIFLVTPFVELLVYQSANKISRARVRGPVPRLQDGSSPSSATSSERRICSRTSEALSAMT